MSDDDHDDPVDAVILAYLDHLDGVAPRPTLEHLTEADRRRAESFIGGLVTARGIDPHASRPSVEALLADTPLAGILTALGPAATEETDLAAVVRVLAAVHGRARVTVDAAPTGAATVVFAYLDLRARFLLVPAAQPALTEAVRATVEAIFAGDPDTSRVGVVAALSDDLVTQVLAAEDLGHTITTPRGEPHLRWEPPLPLALAARRMLEHTAPEWPSFDVDQALGGPVDLAALATQIAHRVIEHRASRSFRGDKRTAYRALVGRERDFAALVAKVGAVGIDQDLTEEIGRIVRAAA